MKKKKAASINNVDFIKMNNKQMQQIKGGRVTLPGGFISADDLQSASPIRL